MHDDAAKISKEVVLRADEIQLSSQGVSARAYRFIYMGGAPWEIGAPQPEVVKIHERGRFGQRILDVGCGFGENAFFLASRGHRVVAIDYLPEVIEHAVADHRAGLLSVSFKLCDVFDLEGKDGEIDTVLDSATFHGFSDTERDRYAALFAQILHPGTKLYIIGFSESECREGGPRRLSSKIIRSVFQPDEWDVVCIWETLYEATLFPGGAQALVAEILKC
jgi:SAM-dependent methyltransferase